MDSSILLRKCERSVLIAILSMSAIGKIAEGRERRSATVKAYQIVPSSLAGPVAEVLPLAEAVVSGGLAFQGRVGRPASLASGVLFLTFAGVMESAVQRGIVSDCGCFGSLSSQRVSRKLVLRNVLLAATAFHLAYDG